mmetsp:Transcript_15833/g.52968  ORF Transcript_15833/g.52968 Transcript_15833/m.52968 type:complete len:670 (-) Transcript_15833:1680-3689(-)
MSYLSGLHQRSFQVEKLVGRDVKAQPGMQVLIAKRYQQDAWMKDESGGRGGRIIKVDLDRPGMCQVCWDRLDGKEWESIPKESELLRKYSGWYKIGHNNVFHLEYIPPEEKHEKKDDNKKVLVDQDMQTQVIFNESIDDESSIDDAQDVKELSLKRDGLSQTLNLLVYKIKDQLKAMLDECSELLGQAENEIQQMASGLKLDLDPAKIKSTASTGTQVQSNSLPMSQEESNITEEVEKIWKAISESELAFKTKLKADEDFQNSLTQLKTLTEPVYLTMSVLQLPELCRKLEKIGMGGAEGRVLVAGSWVAPMSKLHRDSENPDNLIEVRNRLSNVLAKLNDMMYREDKEHRPKLIELLLNSADDTTIQEIIDEINELADMPEASRSKDDLLSIAKILEENAEAFQELKEWEEGGEEVEDLDAYKSRKTARTEILGKIFKASSKDIPEFLGLQEVQVSNELGPYYDIEDMCGGIKLAEMLEMHTKLGRNVIQTLLLRREELVNRALAEQKKEAHSEEKEVQTMKNPENEYYNGRLTTSDVNPAIDDSITAAMTMGDFDILKVRSFLSAAFEICSRIDLLQYFENTGMSDLQAKIENVVLNASVKSYDTMESELQQLVSQESATFKDLFEYASIEEWQIPRCIIQKIKTERLHSMLCVLEDRYLEMVPFSI